jgi:methionine aminopeptidase
MSVIICLLATSKSLKTGFSVVARLIEKNNNNNSLQSLVTRKAENTIIIGTKHRKLQSVLKYIDTDKSNTASPEHRYALQCKTP